MAPKKIIIADDERDIVELVAYNLEREGFSVLKAFDGRRAWEMIRKEKPDLVILDLMMPELPGMEVCRMIRSHPETAATPIIMLTAKSEPLDRILGLEIGADDYLTKLGGVRWDGLKDFGGSTTGSAPGGCAAVSTTRCAAGSTIRSGF